MIYPLTLPSLKGSSSAVQLPSLYAPRTAKQYRMQRHKFLGCTSFEEKLNERFPMMGAEQYIKWSAQQINLEYHDLKQELRRMSDKLNGLIENKQVGSKTKKASKKQKMKSPSASRLSNFNTLQHSTLSPSPSEITLLNNGNLDNLYQGYQMNNQKIFSNNKHELQKLLKREEFILHSKNPHGLKEELKQKIQQIKQEIKEEKKNYKQLMLQSQKVGNDIINTDKLIQQIRILQKQQNVLVLRKRKLCKQVQDNVKNQQAITQGSVEIAPIQPQLNQYEAKKKYSQQKAKTQQELKSLMSKKLRAIAALKRDKQARDKINSKKYYELLTELNSIEERSQTYPNKLTILQTKIQLTQHDCQDCKIEFDQLMARKKQLEKQKINERSSFLTEVQNLQQNEEIRKSTFYQSKQNLEQHKITQKDMMKQISENLQKTQKNLDELQKKLTPRNQLPSEIDIIIDESEKNYNPSQEMEYSNTQSSKKTTKSHAVKESDVKKFHELQDSEIIQESQQLQNSNQVEQLQQRFREKDENELKKGPFRKIRI